MAKKRPDDQEMLRKIGLTDQELRDIQQKFSNFARALDTNELNCLKKSTLTAKQAAETLGPDVTAKQLENFIRSYAPVGATTILFSSGPTNAKPRPKKT